MSSQQGDALELASALCSQLRSTAADSITVAMQYLAGEPLAGAAIDAAVHWIAAAELWEDAFSLLALQFGTPGDLPWLSRLTDDAEFTEILQSTAAVARVGAERVHRVRVALLAAVDRAVVAAQGHSVPEAS